MKIEGQVRIPSGCAISAVISKDGNKMSGEMITNSMIPMHDRSMVWEEALPVMVFTRNIRIFMHYICFLTPVIHEKNVRHS